MTALVGKCSDAVSVHAADGSVLFANAALASMLDHESIDLVGHNLCEFVHNEDVAVVRHAFDLAGTGAGSGEPTHYRLDDAHGSWRNVESVATNLLDEPRVEGIILTTRDVTQRVQTEATLREVAHRDPATGLLNRPGLFAQLERLLGTETNLAVVFLEVDRFDILANARGYQYGDAVLQSFARRLLALVGDATVAHLGIANFVIVIKVDSVTDDFRRGAQHIAEALAAPVIVGGQRLHPTFSIGVATTRRRAVTAADVLQEAATAAHRARGAETTVEVFDAKMLNAVAGRLALEQDLRTVIATADFRLFFQPIVSIADGTVYGAEALLRWGRSGKPKHDPDAFIPVAEETGLIVPLGAWTITEAVKARAALDSQVRVTVNVNLSARQLVEPGLADAIQYELAAYSLEPQTIGFEVTETLAIRDVDLATRVIAEIRALGCNVGIDDFGTGYASLAYLHRLPVNFMKIDRSFVSGLGLDPCTDALVEAMVAMARALQLHVIAEGIETELQHDRLAAMGCTYAQGYLYGKPQASLDRAIAVPNGSAQLMQGDGVQALCRTIPSASAL
jgi:diguanylate cyclase (GGDEF)-like protein/PAS domain S-box-containing protein